MNDTENKVAFAAFLIKTPAEPMAAALKLFPLEKDRGRACQAAFAWPNDPIVLAELERIKGSTEYEDPDIPNKKKLIKMALDVYNNQYTSAKEKNAAIKLIADLQGLIIKATDDSEGKRMPLMPVYKIVET